MKRKRAWVGTDKWKIATYRAQMIIAGVVLLTEIVGNIMLYVTRSQGYGPDTILAKLFRYLFLTTLINFGLIFFSHIVAKRCKSERVSKFVLVICTVLICTDVAYSHYQFASSLLVFVIPILLSILYEDIALAVTALLVSLGGLTLAVVSRALDPLYNTDIAPEAAISYAITISVFLIARIIHNTLVDRRTALTEALLEVEKANAATEKAKLSLKMLETLARAIDAKDKYTNGHSLRVAIYSTLLAESMGWTGEKLEMLKYEALLHDIGKIGVPDSVLNKPGRLSDSEFDIIKSHTSVGANILKAMISVPNAFLVAKHHHERFDGKGYPAGLSGEDIPLNARIVCIADSYDAMNSDRVYRKALSQEIIREELEKGRGTQYDPEILDAFLKLFDEKKLVVTPRLFTLETADDNQQDMIEDIETAIRNTAELELQNNALNDFTKFYEYINNIAKRYNRSVEVLSVTLLSTEREITSDDGDKLETAIRKDIRSVDVYYRHANDHHVIILLDAGKENVDIISKRIAFNFGSGDGLELRFELNENNQY